MRVVPQPELLPSEIDQLNRQVSALERHVEQYPHDAVAKEDLLGLLHHIPLEALRTRGPYSEGQQHLDLEFAAPPAHIPGLSRESITQNYRSQLSQISDSPLNLNIPIQQAWLGRFAPVIGGTAFVNYETPHVTPLALTPDGTRTLSS